MNLNFLIFFFLNLGGVKISKKVLFICTGNTCRSPMAEYFFNEITKDNNEYTAISAGILKTSGNKSNSIAIKVMNENNIDLTSHKSQEITSDLLKEVEYVVCLEDFHLNYLLKYFPQYDEKYMMLSTNNIANPHGGDYRIYKDTSVEVENAVKDFIKNELKFN
ncbi:hypothetical protein [Methanobrevibacter sp. DSM 116169]|uniref:arsenate reductase/protein-tyrosine-phosphatase family protein n=1 Tax=Methanobrevibacter sp. DSM 116169 TaxID=3242727 RepID=UPI0038FCAEB6